MLTSFYFKANSILCIQPKGTNLLISIHYTPQQRSQISGCVILCMQNVAQINANELA